MPAEQKIDFEKIGQQSSKMLADFFGDHHSHMKTMSHVSQAFSQLAQQMMNDPERMVQMQLGLYQSYLALWANMAEKMMGKEVEPLAEPQKGDRRFKAEAWEEHLIFDFIKQSYLLTADWMLNLINETEGLDEDTRQRVDFYTRQYIDALSPSNFPLTNPEVLQATVESKGQNLIDGLNNIIKDIERGEGKLKISMTDYEAFEVGKNLATTEGKVVFKNALFELIHYTPKKQKVYERPLLIIPPWINKFYILDLKPENSFVRFAVEECGLNVFLVSWKNPDESYHDTTFEDYLNTGLFTAVDTVLSITKQKDLNIIGYCIGGTLLASGLSVMAKKNDKRINSATFFTTLIDFSESGELKMFTDDHHYDLIMAKMEKQGYLDGAEMAQTFSMLRANDLIWSFVVNNYLLGKTPFPFDLLYWNDDSTRMPCAMHSYYLKNMYQENNLVKKDKLELDGEKVDITQIKQPLYMVTGVNDHIAPWESCYKPIHKMQAKEKRFILGRAGHVAGVINPPGNKKAFYWAGDAKAKDASTWHKQAEQHEGSWWLDWKKWITQKSGKQVTAPKTLGSAKFKPLYSAPGKYVKEKS